MEQFDGTFEEPQNQFAKNGSKLVSLQKDPKYDYVLGSRVAELILSIKDLQNHQKFICPCPQSIEAELPNEQVSSDQQSEQSQEYFSMNSRINYSPHLVQWNSEQESQPRRRVDLDQNEHIQSQVWSQIQIDLADLDQIGLGFILQKNPQSKDPLNRKNQEEQEDSFGQIYLEIKQLHEQQKETIQRQQFDQFQNIRREEQNKYGMNDGGVYNTQNQNANIIQMKYQQLQFESIKRLPRQWATTTQY